jgi:hypothetical protein
MTKGPTEPTLLPEIERELLRAAQRQHDDGPHRILRVRVAGIGAALAILLTSPSAAALSSSSHPANPSPVTIRRPA